jgi:hypothetical protein
MIRVFVSYAWDNEPHKERVLSFVNWLRQQGFEAELDRMVTQEHTAPDFNQMMHQAMTDHDKVIIVLSERYRERAENFEGGVGKEFRMILADIDDRPKKYIVGSFDGRGRDVAPLALSSREILDLNEDEDLKKLFRKLMDKPELAFSPVAGSVPDLGTRSPAPFATGMAAGPVLAVKGLVVKSTNGTQQYRLYKVIHYEVSADIVNERGDIVKDFSVELHVPKDLVTDFYDRRMEGERVVFDFPSTKSLYKGQQFRTDPVSVEFFHRRVGKVFGESILVKVFGPGGMVEKEFLVKDVFKIPGENGMEPRLLANENFLPEDYF